MEIDLIRKSKKGDSDAFSKLVKMYEKDLYRVAIAMVKNNEDASDCIQDSILKAYKSIGKLKKEEYFKTWLIKILINNCKDTISKEKKFTSLLQVSKEAFYEENLEYIEIQEVIDNLDEDLKVLIILYYYEDMSIKDISESLGISEGTIKSRMSRARSKLKSMLNEVYSEVL